MKKIIFGFIILKGAMLNAFSIRLAEPNDNNALARIHYISWQKAYLGVHSKTFYEQQDENSFITYWNNYFEHPKLGSFVLVATQEEEIIGFVSAGSIQEKSSYGDNHDCELYKLYIAPEAQGLGLGKHLLNECKKTLRELNYKKMIIRAIKENKPSCIFLTKNKVSVYW